jgi:hypothetical protein
VSRAAAHGKAEAKPGSAQALADAYEAEVQAAIEAYEHQELAEARKHFKLAHELQPSARTYRGLGVTAFGLGMYSEAVDELSHAVSESRRPLTSKLRQETEHLLTRAKERVSQQPPSRESTASAQAPLPAEGSSGQSQQLTPFEYDDPNESTPPAATGGLGTQKILAIAAGVLGVAGIVTGTVFGVQSISKGNLRDRLCTGDVCSDDRGFQAGKDAISAGNISTVAFIIGGVALAGGVVLWVTDRPREQPPQAQLRLRMGLASLQLEGSL